MKRVALPKFAFIVLIALGVTVPSAARAGAEISPADHSAASSMGTPSQSVESATHDGAPSSAEAPGLDGEGSSSTGAIVSAPSVPDKLDGAEAETPGERAYFQTKDASILDSHSWALTAYKSRHQLIVYYKGRLFKIYHAVFGRSEEHGTKLWSGDRRTPEGLYVIVKKHASHRWKWFLRLNYPNKVDRYRYEELRDQKVVPIANGRPVPEGGAIGIHGTDLPVLNSGNVDWTTGCISVDNDAIAELDRLLPIGTIVIIKP